MLALVLVASLAASLAAAAAEAGELVVTPLLDLRVRQEFLDGVYHFADDPDRDWLRVRTRGGGRLDAGAHRFEVRLGNEHRHVLDPEDVEFDWDELFVDHAFWSWSGDDRARITVGRQDLVWLGGFLVMDGNPLDGSRSQFVDAVRCELREERGSIELAVLRNQKRDPFVLAGDLDRAQADADETALACLVQHDAWAWTAVYKFERDPDALLADLATLTLACRRQGTVGAGGAWRVEAALQRQDGAAAAAYTDRDPGETGYALAGEGSLTTPLGDGYTLEVGAFYYSGQSASLRPFRAPWGRWPKWSELYIYTLLGESTQGRAHVAAWENIAAPRAACSRALGERMTARLAATCLVAPASSWESRGLLTQAELKIGLGHGLDGHLLWEMLVPGAYHDGRHDLPPLVGTVHFLRWQMAWAL